MEAPKGRYSVVEKDGRLIVIDNSTGAPATPSMPPPRSGPSDRFVLPGRSGPPVPPASPGRPGPPGLSPAPIVAGKGALDSVADFLLAIAVKEWDEDGKAVIAWEWKQNGKTKRWDAKLDTAQQRRLGRALVGLAGAPLGFLSIILLSGPAMWIALALAATPFLWAMLAIGALQSQTGVD